MMRYYWAYGSNLCEASMRVRCPAARKVGRLFLTDAQLVFRGVADVVSFPGGTVPGGLWKITHRCERALDQYEGVSSRFYKKRYIRVRVHGQVRSVLFYQMTMGRGVMPPTNAYLDTIARGYADFGLDTLPLDEAFARSWSEKELTPRLRRRRADKGMVPFARLEDAA